MGRGTGSKEKRGYDLGHYWNSRHDSTSFNYPGSLPGYPEMDNPTQQYDDLIRSAAHRLKGHQRRLFQAEVAHALCGGSPRGGERPYGWGRDFAAAGLNEARSGPRCG